MPRWRAALTRAGLLAPPPVDPPPLDDPSTRARVTIPRRPTDPPRVVVAAAARVVPGNVGAVRRARQRWQGDAWVYRDAIPEVRYAHNFLGNAASQVAILAAELGRDGEEPIDFDSEECTLPPEIRDAARAAMARLTGDAASHGVILAPVVQNFETVGECYLLGFTNPDTAAEEWSVRSVDELRITDEGYRLLEDVAQQAGGTLLPFEGTYVARLWSPHPRFAAWPDSPMRALLDVCEELLLAGRGRRAALRNRLAGNGILKVPNELITAPAPGPRQAEDPYSGDGLADDSDVQASKFMTDLTAAMTTPIGDESAASAVVPLLVRGDAEALKALEHLTLDRPMDKHLADTEEKALRRLGTGLDVPPEVISGLSDVNHWTAWQIDTSTWTHHVEPIVAAACAALTIGYLRATLLTMGFPLPLVNRVVVWYDPENLVHDPRQEEEVGDTGRSPQELSTLATVAQVLVTTGFDPTAVLAALDLPELPFIGPPTPAAPAGQPPAEEQPAEGPPPDDAPQVPALPRAATAGPLRVASTRPEPDTRAQRIARGQAALARLQARRRPALTAAADDDQPPTPTPEQERLSRRLMELDRRLRERLVGACDAALSRVLERAGNRVRSAAVRASGMPSLSGVPGPQVPGTLGRPVVAALGLDEAELLADEYARLRGQYETWTTAATQDAIDTAIRLLGADTNSEEIRRLVGELQAAYSDGIAAGWEFLQAGLADVAEQHLYHPDPDVPDLGEAPGALVNPSLVRGSLATAGGLHTAIGGLTRDGLPGAANRGVGGIGTGELLSDFMRGQGAGIAEYEWAYGISERVFHPHHNLDGTRFPTWGAPELSTAGTGHEWIGGSFAPGDHKGCHCDYLPVWTDGVRQRDVLEEIGDVAGGRATDAARGTAVQGPRRRTVPPAVPYTGEDRPPAQPVGKDTTRRATRRKPSKDEAGVPYRLTYSYLRKLSPEQHDELLSHLAVRIGDGDPRELARWEQYEAWEAYETAEFEHVAQHAGEDADVADVRRIVDDFAARNGTPGLTHPRVGGRSLTHLGYDERGRGLDTPSRRQVQEEYALHLEEQFLDAEAACRGHFRNAAGLRRNVSLHELLSGPVAEVYRYASPELLEYLETHRRVTWTEFYYARTGSPAFAERAARHARENASINRDRTDRGSR